jgi:long-subunit acyl-CoA synthetase (AMP-forming)
VHNHYPVKLLLCHPDSIVEAVKACEQVGFDSRIIVLMKREFNFHDSVTTLTEAAESCSSLCSAGGDGNALAEGFPTLDKIIEESKGADLPPKVNLSKQEAHTKLALLSFSSGTTGLPKGKL